MAGYDILMEILDERKVEALMSNLHKQDRQAEDLLADCLSKLSDAFNLPSGQQQALARLRSLIRDGQNWDAGLIRNNVFKIADSLGMRLPSAMFASQKEASELEQAWGPVLPDPNQRTAAGGPGYVRRLLAEAHEKVKDAKGGLYYRLHGQGAIDSLTREYVLDEPTRRKAKDVDAKVDKILKALGEVLTDLRNLDLQFD